jgi:hypothetical protein
MAQIPLWTQTGDLHLSEGITVEFRGMDGDAKEAFEIQKFSRAVQEPVAEDLGHMGANRKSFLFKSLTNETAFRLIVGGTLGYLCAEGFALVGVQDSWVRNIAFATCLVGSHADRIFLALSEWLTAARLTEQRFRLCFNGTSFSHSGERCLEQRYRLQDIAHFEGHKRLELVLQSGKRVVLQATLPSREHAAFADVLNGLLGEAKTVHGSYRESEHEPEQSSEVAAQKTVRRGV